METAPLGDDVGVLLQTYDALEAFLLEMDALDHDGELVRPCAPSSPRVTFSQQLIEHNWDVAPVKTEDHSSGAGLSHTPTALAPMTTSTDTRKRKFELRTSAVVTVTTDASACKRPARRRRQKDELLQLREQALAMETQLAQLQAALPRPAASAQAPKSRAMELWERRAVQSRQRKRATETENSRLREIASKELKISFEIEKMLIKCYTSSVRTDAYFVASSCPSHAHTDALAVVGHGSSRSCRCTRTRTSHSTHTTCFCTRCSRRTPTRGSATSRRGRLRSQTARRSRSRL